MSSNTEDTETSLQAQLADSRAQVEHWQGVATICELSKQEELAELQKQCDQEIQSLQEALRETAAQYEARIAVLQSQPVEWRRASGQNMISGRKVRMDAEVSSNESSTLINNSLTEAEASLSAGKTHSQPAELEAVAEGEGGPLTTEGYFSLRNCDSASLSSFSLDTPSLPRKLHAQDDTDSLVSTGTLVPEAIYLPPAGHRLVTHCDWDALNAQVSELRGEVSRLQAEKEELERELDTQTNHTHKQVTMLQSQVQTSEALLQDLQKSFSQSQNAVQSRLAELSLSQRKMCSELCRLKGEEVEEEVPDSSSSFQATLQGAHCEERLRIEIVNLREQLDTRTEENDVLEVQLSSLKTETERIQAHKDQLQAELLACRTELEALRVALSHVQSTNKALSSDKAALQQQCLELRSQVISLRSQVETSQTVQRDFVQLSQSLQVKLELIRQAESLEQVREILEEGVSEAGSSPADAS
ncbi:rab GTPase-binding effector protein 2 isoform X1 [Seriola lalandi dorsalis]|uniref:rab GTPase-binding effector protein 2 isoform X1 n=1 Tax=Seriola lalandi dorsalis TaxID=1841481 RepID=UPI000C6F6F32|nr:rab GTPase-binding effector protein 2 isoform X1 [Seriola lalandi dorsalis]XP_056257729.1 rab GTPase-binding effector protein 2 isoform X1 [Seriola aureovittata]